MDKNNRNNQVFINGKIVSDFEFDYEVYGEKFYRFYLEISRKSNVADVIPVVVSERLVDVKTNCNGYAASVSGEYRSFNLHQGKKISLLLSVFAKDIEFMDYPLEFYENNNVLLHGTICKEPIFRTTPLGRDISDIVLAVNRDYGKSDYIPCIFWGRNAKYITNQPVGTVISIVGRIQSREYKKALADGSVIEKVAYEVSVKGLEVLEDERD